MFFRNEECITCREASRIEAQRLSGVAFVVLRASAADMMKRKKTYTHMK